MNTKEVEREAIRLKELINKSTKELENLKERHWIFGDDTQYFDSVSISSNYGSWIATKERSKERPFHIKSNNNNTGMGFTLRDAKDIVKYLQEKIEYLES